MMPDLAVRCHNGQMAAQNSQRFSQKLGACQRTLARRRMEWADPRLKSSDVVQIGLLFYPSAPPGGLIRDPPSGSVSFRLGCQFLLFPWGFLWHITAVSTTKWLLTRRRLIRQTYTTASKKGRKDFTRWTASGLWKAAGPPRHPVSPQLLPQVLA